MEEFSETQEESLLDYESDKKRRIKLPTQAELESCFDIQVLVKWASIIVGRNDMRKGVRIEAAIQYVFACGGDRKILVDYVYTDDHRWQVLGGLSDIATPMTGDTLEQAILKWMINIEIYLLDGLIASYEEQHQNSTP